MTPVDPATRSEMTHAEATRLDPAQPEITAPSEITAAEQAAPVLEVDGLSKTYRATRWRAWRPERYGVQALKDVSFTLNPGECLGLVGESGSGKSTLALCLTRLIEPDSGRVIFRGQDFSTLSGRELRATRRRVQLVFQDSAGALDPQRRIGDCLFHAAMKLGGARRSEQQTVADLLDSVGLAPALAQRYPHELSGGQRQRITIARALAAEPEVLILDEPVSALDVAVRNRILDRLHELRQDLGLSLLFIGHDLGVIERFADRVAVLYMGQVVESGHAGRVFKRPLHPYTEALVASIPPSRPDPRFLAERKLEGEIPSPENPPTGCLFHPRCSRVTELCRNTAPALSMQGESAIACHHPLESGGLRVEEGPT